MMSAMPATTFSRSMTSGSSAGTPISVRTEMGVPALEPLVIDRLKVVAGIADIMVAGHRAKPHSQAAHQLRGIPQILFDIGGVHGNVPRMDDEVGALRGDPA